MASIREIIMISLYNTVTGKKESVVSQKDKPLLLYVCGITPYDYAHIGHGRCYIMFDVLYRLAKFHKMPISYCRNFTDIDDKLLNKAHEEFGDKYRYTDIAQRYIDAYLEDMEQLGCAFPDHQPRVTQVIPDIIAFIETLIKKNAAYVVDGDVYFRVAAYKPYGTLAKKNLDELQSGVRVQVNEKKENPLDFVLWKGEPQGTFWKSPWGYGRPGWHTECCVMAEKFLAPTIDIHGGGMDLMFPHHENERAQAELAFGKTFAKEWMHVAFVRIDKEKMSKSLGNFFTLRQVFNAFDPMVVRFYVLNHHYRSPIDFSFQDLEVAEKTYRRLCTFFAQKSCPVTFASASQHESPIMKNMLRFLDDDLNTVGMWGVLFENLDNLGDEFCTIKSFIQNVLGLSLQPLMPKIICITPEIQALMNERIAARADKDFKRADEIRDQLRQLGVDVNDGKIK